MRYELIQGRVKENARKLLTTSICIGHLSLSVVVWAGSRALNTDPGGHEFEPDLKLLSSSSFSLKVKKKKKKKKNKKKKKKKKKK
ncbi:MAG: hypothetical protein MI923_17885, partial [Phycisphaerales bacterium]|nr:hypothetical protein [Phycisphaerales bacterium]